MPSATVGEAKGLRMSWTCGRTAPIADHRSQLRRIFEQKSSCEKNDLDHAEGGHPDAEKIWVAVVEIV